MNRTVSSKPTPAVVLDFAHTVLQSEIFRGSQSWDLVHVVCSTHPDNGNPAARYRAVIHRDGYDAQSYVRADRWDGHKWQHVADLPIATTHAVGVSYVEKLPPTAAFFNDAAAVLNLAFQIGGA